MSGNDGRESKDGPPDAPGGQADALESTWLPVGIVGMRYAISTAPGRHGLWPRTRFRIAALLGSNRRLRHRG